jgi:hypothetical protein
MLCCAIPSPVLSVLPACTVCRCPLLKLAEITEAKEVTFQSPGSEMLLTQGLEDTLNARNETG